MKIIRGCVICKKLVKRSSFFSIKNFTISQNEKEKEMYNEVLESEEYRTFFPETQILGSLKQQNVLVIQPNMKSVPLRLKDSPAELELAELCSLVESIPSWKIVDKSITSLKRMDRVQVFGKGKLVELTEHINKLRSSVKSRDEHYLIDNQPLPLRSCSSPSFSSISLSSSSFLSLDSVVLGVNSLNYKQRIFLSNIWKLPIYDRFSLILKIFKLRASSYEAKLQISLAEVHYLRTRFHDVDSLLDEEGGGEERTNNDRFHIKKNFLKIRESKLRRLLERLKNQRERMSQQRKNSFLPLIGVLGYTNAGKTSLIKSLTNLESLKPLNKLFATLDFSCFQGQLPNNLKVTYLDSIGFISNIPSFLFEAFQATMMDLLHSDILIIVEDSSHPDKEAQNKVVLEMLKKILKGSEKEEKLKKNLITVHNKVDLLSEEQRIELEKNVLKRRNKGEFEIIMSLKENIGREELLNLIQNQIIKITKRVEKKLKVSISGSLLPWLYKETTVEEVLPDPTDSNKYLMKVSMTPKNELNKQKFCFCIRKLLSAFFISMHSWAL